VDIYKRWVWEWVCAHLICKEVRIRRRRKEKRKTFLKGSGTFVVEVRGSQRLVL
jgi:hypothetical protein